MRIGFVALVAVTLAACGPSKLQAGGLVDVKLHQSGVADQDDTVAFDDQKDLVAPPATATVAAGTCTMSGTTSSGTWSMTIFPPTGPDAFGKPQAIKGAQLTHAANAMDTDACSVTLADGATFQGTCAGAQGPDGSDLAVAIVGTGFASSAGDGRTADLTINLRLHNCGG